jgi:hypothetical protein
MNGRYEIRIREDVGQGVAGAMVWAEVEAVVADGPWQRTSRIVVEWHGGTWHAGLLPEGKCLVVWDDEQAARLRDEATEAGLFKGRYLADGVTAEDMPRVMDRLRVMAEAAACKH